MSGHEPPEYESGQPTKFGHGSPHKPNSTNLLHHFLCMSINKHVHSSMDLYHIFIDKCVWTGIATHGLITLLPFAGLSMRTPRHRTASTIYGRGSSTERLRMGIYRMASPLNARTVGDRATHASACGHTVLRSQHSSSTARANPLI